MGERFLYIPSIALCVLVGSILSRLSIVNKRVIYKWNIILMIIGIVLMILSINRNSVWKDDKKLFQNVLEVAPENVKASYNLGVIFLKEGKYEKAADYFNKAIAIYPSYYDAYLGLAFIHYYKGEWWDGVNKVREALRIFKQNEEAYALLAELYFKLGMREKAKEAYLEGINNLPATFLLNYKLALEYFVDEKWKEAENNFYAALRVSDLPEIHYYLGRCALYQKDKYRALKEFGKSYSIYKEKPEIIKYLAYLYLETNNNIKAKELVLLYIREFPMDAEGFALAAKIFWEAFNDYKAAHDYITIAYKLNSKVCRSLPFVKVCQDVLN